MSDRAVLSEQKIKKILDQKTSLMATYEKNINAGLWKREYVSALIGRLQVQIDYFTRQLDKFNRA